MAMDRVAGTWVRVEATSEKHIAKIFLEILAQGEDPRVLYRKYLATGKHKLLGRVFACMHLFMFCCDLFAVATTELCGGSLKLRLWL